MCLRSYKVIQLMAVYVIDVPMLTMCVCISFSVICLCLTRRDVSLWAMGGDETFCLNGENRSLLSDEPAINSMVICCIFDTLVHWLLPSLLTPFLSYVLQNELAILEFIHLLVETMDRHFGNVVSSLFLECIDFFLIPFSEYFAGSPNLPSASFCLQISSSEITSTFVWFHFSNHFSS